MDLLRAEARRGSEDPGRDQGRGRGGARQGVHARPRAVRLGAAEDAEREDRAARSAREGARRGSRRPLDAREPRGRWTRSRMPSGAAVALVTGGGRGIGAGVARELAAAGWHVTVSGRTAEQVEEVAQEIGGQASSATSPRRGRRADGRRDAPSRSTCSSRTRASPAGSELVWETDPDDWWRVFEVNVRGVFLTCRAGAARDGRARRRPHRDQRRAARPICRARPRRRLRPRARRPSAASARCSRSRSRHTASRSSSSARGSSDRDDGGLGSRTTRPGRRRSSAPQLVRELASGRFDQLAGRYSTPSTTLRTSSSGAREDPRDDLNAIRLRREPT